jgi:hypothetical protein
VETPDLFSLFVRPLHAAGLRYMVSGSLASIFYGEPRLTLDVDLVVHLDGGEAIVLAGLFSTENFYVPPPDVVALEIARPTRGHFNVIHFASGQKADFYPSRRHPWWSWAFEHRRLGRLGPDEIWFAPPEYVILWKLEFFREGGGDKHLRDIRGMLLVNAENIDRAMLDAACAELGLSEQWKRAQAG